jgi:hypothetical protein
MTPCTRLSQSVARALRSGLSLCILLAAAAPGELPAQVASQSVNMVSGIQWPGGDPFLQRQNEPSIAMSSRNPRHLLAGANDYRTVDIPFPPSPPNTPPETGDAWLGVFKSFDGGLTWKSTLLPGYPQQPGGPVGPLAGFTTAADPVVRAGTNGLFYYSGIAFNRGTNLGVLFVSRFMDLNNKENGDPVLNQDPIRYIDTQIVDRAPAASSPFIDKPWIAVDKPRLLDGVCKLTVPQPQTGNPGATVTQTVPAGSVYAAWTEATGTGSSLTTNIFFSYSRDCGGSWGRPVMVNGANRVNQGASIAIDPATGVINVVWRRFASGSQTDAIMIARSLRGVLFSTPSVVASLPPYNAANPTAPSFFDQGTSIDSFRTNAYPTIAIDRRPNAGTEDTDEPDTATYRGRIFVAWSQRGVGPGGDARIVLSVSTDGASTWSVPMPIDNAALSDDSGTSFSRGHQFMPQMTVTADKITVIYYDARLDHTFGLFSPRANPLTPDPVTGRLYLETRTLRGELLDPGGAARVFTPFFVETGMTEWRHTLDLRVAQADSAVSPAFTSARLSQYIFGTRGDETGIVASLQQLQINPPNLRLFQQGTVPFLGDYIDVAGPTFLPPSAPGRRWRFNSLPGTNPVFLASWTSNQDVRPPLDGDWTHYTPPTSAGTGSVFNPSVPRPPCQTGQEGMRNQNIYAARISQGLAVSSVQNAKPLSPTLQRDLTVNVENLTPLSRTFRLTIAGQPVGGRASFVPAPNPVPNPLPTATTTLDVVIPANSSIARSVYALSTDPKALVEVDVAEVNGRPGSPLKTNGLSGFVTFNSDTSAPTLVNPDNSTGPPVTTVEVYNPNVTNPNVTNPNVTNPNVTNPNVTNPNVTNPNVTNPNVTNPNVTNPDLANPNVTNPNVTNPNVTNPNVTNPNVTNPNVTNAPVSDATYTVTNTGNTASTYHVQLAGTAPTGTPLQLIITKPYANPASLNCVLFEQQHNLPVASVVNPTFVDPNLPPNPAITDPSDGNATFVLGPGESVLVTIRGPVDIPTLTNIIQNLTPVVVAHAPNTNDPTNQPATSPPSITTAALPDGATTEPYSAAPTALGGTRPYVAWVATGLPAGLSISATTGQITGTPSASGTYSVGISVTDSATKTGSRSYTLRIADPLVIMTASLSNGSLGTAYSQTLATAGGLGTKTWSLATGSLPLPPGIGLSTAGVLSGTPTATGTYPFTVQVVDSGNPQQTATEPLSITVGCGDPSALAASISAASGTTQTINLTAGCTYTFTAGSAGDTFTALPHITSGTNLTINGNGSTIQRSSASGTPAFRLLAVDGGGALTLNSVSITNGGCGNGASCNNLEGGGAYVGTSGTLNVVLSTFTGNQTGVDSTNSRGGAIESFGALTVDRSTFTSNQAQNNGGAIFNWGGTLSVTNSTFASNTAQNVGGAIVAFSPNASTIANSTFVGNTAYGTFWEAVQTGSAIYNQSYAGWGQGFPSGPLTVTSSTFSGNGANGTITTEAIPFVLSNSVVSGSAGANCAGTGAANDGGYNISSDASCGFLPTTGSLSSTDPQLDPAGLSSAGGPTQVVVPLPGSPAVDAISSSVNGCGTSLTTDQRGATRPTGVGCDIGAVEFPPVFWGGATITNVQLNGGGNVLTLPGGGAFTLSHDYRVANDPSCPGCIDQIQVGLSINAGPQICSYFGIPPVTGVSGNATVGLTVPAASGTYFVGIDWSEQYSCVAFWSTSNPTPNRYIGKVIVP